MTRVIFPAAALLVAVALVAMTSCKKQPAEDGVEPYKGPPPVGKSEEQRGIAACNDYQTKICACAEANPAVKQDCDLAPARISAIELSMRMAVAENASNDDRAAAISNARRTMQKCIERVAELSLGCPTPAPPKELEAPEAPPGNVR